MLVLDGVCADSGDIYTWSATTSVGRTDATRCRTRFRILYRDIPLKPPREKLARVLFEDTYTLVAEFVLLLVSTLKFF